MLKNLLNDNFISGWHYFVYKQNILNMVLIFAICIIFVAIINSKIRFINNKLLMLINTFFLITSIVIIVLYTLVRDADKTEINLIPFCTFFRIKNNGNTELTRSFFMNVFLFVPLGLSMPYVLSQKPRRWPVFVTIAFAAVLSVGIEFLQYYYHLGRCETDDVIANILGATVGTLSYLLYMKILKNQEKGSLMQKINNNQTILLDLCAKSLFDKDVTIPDELDCSELIEESKTQTVFPCCYSLIKDKCDDAHGKTFSQIIAKNIRVEYAHNEVHRVLSENNIPYVILKGVASASYYKEPMLRMMGDVDVLVRPNDIAKADKLLNSIGFITTDDIDSDDMHIGYKRKDGVACELHRKIGWAPNNSIGDIIKEYFNDIYDKSQEYKTSNGGCIVPCKFHHGLILLLHTATHITHEGVGLRHLCDWAVFANSFSNEEFINTFEKPLKEMGLWRFAQLLTLCCVQHLGCDEKAWAGQADDDLIDGIVSDILNGGNFGNKDTDRYNQIKYISDRKDGTTAKKNPILQLFDSINEKTKKEFKFVNKSKLFLPLGWLFTVVRYIYMVIVGKRTLDGVSTVSEAKKRKDIYNAFKLYENDQT
ncbi:MAG: nucleotidyltransferase family protein [Clostridia bacterium]|nr:nucleotidyltransferase family protein [Clostridia bacterium]